MGIHLVPTGDSQTYKLQGSKHISEHKMEDKRQILVVVFFSSIGELLPFQVFFTRCTA